MQLSAYSDYSFRVLMHAAVHAPRRVTVDEVAAGFGISRHHLVKIVHELGQRGYLATHRGIGGGFTLGQPAARIRLGDIVRLGEERESMIDCSDKQDCLCRISSACVLKDVLEEAAAAFFAVMDRHTLEDLVKQPARIRALMED